MDFLEAFFAFLEAFLAFFLPFFFTFLDFLEAFLLFFLAFLAFLDPLGLPTFFFLAFLLCSRRNRQVSNTSFHQVPTRAEEQGGHPVLDLGQLLPAPTPAPTPATHDGQLTFFLAFLPFFLTFLDFFLVFLDFLVFCWAEQGQ